MNRFKRLLKGSKKFFDEINKPDSFVKGEEFEDYVRKYMFPQDNYQLIHKTHNYENNRDDFVESSLLPDFKLRDLKNGREFYVECKFRNGYLNQKDQIEWCNKNQLKRYQRIHKNDAPVFIALGFGDKGSYPEDLCLFSLREAKWTGLYPSFLDKYEFYLDKPVFSGYLWKL